MTVRVHIEPEEGRSLEMALRALQADDIKLAQFGFNSSALTLAIDDLQEIIARVETEQKRARESVAFRRMFGRTS